MTESKTKSRYVSRSQLFGSPIAWIAVYAALVGVTSLVPVLPYAGGGGYWPLATPIAALAPLLIGLPGGVVASFVGGLIGMFIAPPAYPLGVLDAFNVAATPAILVGLALSMKKYWKYFIPLDLLSVVAYFVVMFYYPGAKVFAWAGVSLCCSPTSYLISGLYYWLVPLVVLASPIGTKYIYNMARNTNVRSRSIGVFLGSWMAMNAYYYWPAFWEYWVLYSFPTALLGVMNWAVYSWYEPLFAVLVTIIAVPLAEALRKSGMAKPPDVIW